MWFMLDSPNVVFFLVRTPFLTLLLIFQVITLLRLFPLYFTSFLSIISLVCRRGTVVLLFIMLCNYSLTSFISHVSTETYVTRVRKFLASMFQAYATVSRSNFIRHLIESKANFNVTPNTWQGCFTSSHPRKQIYAKKSRPRLY